MQEIVEAIRVWRDMRGVSLATLDHITGWPEGYGAKLLSATPIKNLGWQSLGLGLNALAINGDRRPGTASLLNGGGCVASGRGMPPLQGKAAAMPIIDRKASADCEESPQDSAQESLATRLAAEATPRIMLPDVARHVPLAGRLSPKRELGIGYFHPSAKFRRQSRSTPHR